MGLEDKVGMVGMLVGMQVGMLVEVVWNRCRTTLNCELNSKESSAAWRASASKHTWVSDPGQTLGVSGPQRPAKSPRSGCSMPFPAPHLPPMQEVYIQK